MKVYIDISPCYSNQHKFRFINAPTVSLVAKVGAIV